MAKSLTKKQLKVLDLILGGMAGRDAVMQVYNCKSRNSAGVIAHKLFKNELFIEELRERQKLLRQQIIEKEAKFIDILKEFAPPRRVAEKLAELIFSGDKRTADSAIEKYLKLSALYPDTKIGLYHDLQRQRESVLTEADLLRLEARKKLEAARKELADEGEVIKEAGQEKDT